MISDDITTDQVLQEIDQQIEFLEAVEDKSPVFSEQLRIFREVRSLVITQVLRLQRLEELVDWETVSEFDTVINASELNS